jgi:hypothetical protein
MACCAIGISMGAWMGRPQSGAAVMALHILLAETVSAAVCLHKSLGVRRKKNYENLDQRIQ